MSTRKCAENTIAPSVRVLALLFLVAGTLLGTGCEINKPEMPTFESRVTLPLGLERIDVLEAVESEEYLREGADGGIVFSIEGLTDTLALDFDLAAAVSAQSVQQELGNFDLGAVDPVGFGFALSDIWPPAAGMSGLPTVVPPFPIDTESGDEDLPDIDRAELESGTLTVTVTNGLPVAVSDTAPPDQLVLDLLDPGTGIPLVCLLFDRIGPGEQASRVADLSGVTLPGMLRVRITGGSPGSQGQIVNVSGSDSLSIDAVFSDLVVSAAQAVVPAQNFQTTFDTELPADYQVSRAVIESGTLDLDLVNGLPVPCTAVLVWDQVRDLDGAPLSAFADLAPGGSATRVVDFGGYIVTADSGYLTTLTARVQINTPGSGTGTVDMNATDGLTADLADGTLRFSSVTGVVPSHLVTLEPTEITIDLPDQMDGIELTAAALTLNITNSAGIGGLADLMVTGVSEAGQARDLAISNPIDAAVGRAASVTTLRLDRNNSTIVDFLNNLPETITLDGTVEVGGAGQTGTVRPGEYALVDYVMEAPFEVIITGSTLTADPKPLDLDEDLRQKIDSHARGAVITTEILNHLPVAVDLMISAALDSLSLVDAPLLTIGPLHVAAGQVDPATHQVVQGIISRPAITLSDEEARIFGRAGLMTRIQATLLSTGGQPIRMLTTDYLEVRGIVELDILVDDNF